MRALVTGASGLIGANLVRELSSRGATVRSMVRSTSRLLALEGVPTERVVADVLDPPRELASVLGDCDVVFHAAAHFTYSRLGAAELDHTALVGTRNVLEAAARADVKRVIVTSSSVVFGSSTQPLVRSEADQPDDDFSEPDYVQTKIRQDRLAQELGESLGLEVVLVCPTMSVGAHGTVLGPSNAVIIGYLSDPLRMTYPGGCNIVSVRDVARGHWLAATRGQPGERYVLGGENLRWREIHEAIAELCGVARPRVEINHTLAFLAATAEELRASGEQREPLTTRHQARMVGRYYWYSHSRAASIGYAPMPARRALAEACAWLAASPHVTRELRTTLTLSAEVQAARRMLAGTAPGAS